MQLNFRHGIVRSEIDNTGNPTFLRLDASHDVVYIDVITRPTVFTISHGDADYLFEESKTTQAWTGPFPTDRKIWLYWDIDIITGLRTYGYTDLDPSLASFAPPSPANGQHWYDQKVNMMKVWNGAGWQEKLRVFAGQLNQGAILTAYRTGSQVGYDNYSVDAGYILFDDTGKPVKKYDRFNRGKFFTTETPLSSQFPKVANFRLETGLPMCHAVEHIPKWHAVCYKGFNQIGLASYHDVNRPAVGISSNTVFPGDNHSFHYDGMLHDPLWNWPKVNAPLFVGPTGEITLEVPQVHSVQQIGMVVDRTTIKVSIGPHIQYIES